MSKFHGFTLIEILIALALFAVSLFSTAQLFLFTFQSLQASYWHSIAELEARKIAEQCVRTNNSNYQLALWQSEVKRKLPSGNVKIETDQRMCHVNLQWANHEFFTVLISK